MSDRTSKINYSIVRVLLDKSDETYHLTLQSPVYLHSGEEILAYIESGNVIECISDNDEIKLSIRGKSFNGDAFVIKPSQNKEAITFNGLGYKGNLKLIKLGGSIAIINFLKLQDYVKGVVAAEMPVGKNSENFEALKAFSICVRTYALNKISRGNSLYDLYDDTRDQVYGGLNAENPLSNIAVEETENRILSFEGEVATIYYHSTCGGYTEAANNIFTDKELPYMYGIEDGNPPYCKISPKFEWKEVYNPNDLIRRLSRSDLIDNENYSIEDIYIKSRFSSGRVREMIFELVGDYEQRESISLFGNNIRGIIRTANNKNILWSTFFDVSLNQGKLEVIGNGFGHGVGMCQWGAISISRKGRNYEEIIDHYFPGTKITTLND